MFITRVAQQLLFSRPIRSVYEDLQEKKDARLCLAQSARTLLVAALFTLLKRPIVYVVSGEEQSQRARLALEGWLGRNAVFHVPTNPFRAWSEKEPDPACMARRARAEAALMGGHACVVVTSARSLMTRVAPRSAHMYQPISLHVGDRVEINTLSQQLLRLGYTLCANAREVAAPARFCVVGDSVYVFGADATSAVRIEFFDDEIDAIHSIIVSTGQALLSLDVCEFWCARAFSLDPQTIQRAKNNLYDAAQDDSDIQADLARIEAGIYAPELGKYLPKLYNTTESLIDFAPSSALVVLSEPRSLFDDCTRAYEEIVQDAQNARVDPEGLYTSPQALDFGSQQRLSLSSFDMVHAAKAPELKVETPGIRGSQAKLIQRIHELLALDTKIVFSVPARDAASAFELAFSDAGIAFSHECSLPAPTPKIPLPHGQVVLFEDPVQAGVVIPSAHLAIFALPDLSSHTSYSSRAHKQHVNPAQLSFSFKPGDFVVHANHGVGRFKEIVQQQVAGKLRDYFLLIYAHDDKLYVPFEQVDKLTRYVGAHGEEPRLTRLNCADWSRACERARKSAKKMAFDLVDLYTRRSLAKGFAFSPDTTSQLDMEADFPYELTRDQARALEDIKKDMEAPRPMDRLLCGDVGFGKTEVALRAAFKCTQDKRQVMVLCPTTILAQQHFETFFKRFCPYGLNVCVLSRFVKPKDQKAALEGFQKGSVDVLIGTHRLLSSDVNPKNLGLVIIDEEQRFGVQHKEQLKNIREQIDVLTLSATPIPRTLQMALAGSRDMSLILTPPTGRRAVKVHVGEWDEDVVSDAIRYELHRKGQVYYVSNRVQTIEEAKERVRAVAGEARIGVAHGQMSANEIEDVMLAFSEGEIDILVATTIIESGIDNPRTNTLIIEDAQNLGLAQLYQLKGRVGRGHVQAWAYFMFDPQTPITEEATRRLLAIYEHQELGSGIRIAMRDLEIRGAGSLMGAEQHGNLSSIGFDLYTQMLKEAVEHAQGNAEPQEERNCAINIAADFYLSQDYIADVDKRVDVYRMLAWAQTLEDIQTLETDTVSRFGEMDEPCRNLFTRARIRIRAVRLGLASISCAGKRLVLMGIVVPHALAYELKQEHALYYPKSQKISYPLAHAQDALAAALTLLEHIGGGDED